ncbi:hypothetical protein [Ideonella sp.]|uniref:hypothetical protein n=1 Tax=Ideonella sp. TaxID=1929293 RepID=UPI003BB703B7
MKTHLANENEALISLVRGNDHEEKTEVLRTLPNAEADTEQHHSNFSRNRSVMWAAPDQREGSRSESPPAKAGTASGVTPAAPAQRGDAGGATVAVPDKPRLAQPAGVNVIAAIDSEDSDSEVSATEATTDVRSVDEPIAYTSIVNEAWARLDAHGPVLSEPEVQENFAIVRKARALMSEIKREREKARHTEPGEGSIKDYEGDVAVLDRRAKLLEEESNACPLCAALAHYAPTSSYYKMHGAAMWRARSEVASLLALQDRRQRDGPRSLMWDHVVRDLGIAVWKLEQVRALSREEARKINAAPIQPKRSKKSVLRQANSDWRDLFFAETERSDKYRHACFLAAACGMRPKELEQGVLVSRVGDRVAIKIYGAKVRAMAGQEWRGVFVPATKCPGWFLDDLTETPKQFTAPADAMRSYLGRLSPKVFPPKPNKPQLILSEYVLRHCVATDLWQENWSLLEIAAVLGERAEETARHYGLRTRGAKWRKPDVFIERGTVKTVVPVRPRDNSFVMNKKLTKAQPRSATSGGARKPSR